VDASTVQIFLQLGGAGDALHHSALDPELVASLRPLCFPLVAGRLRFVGQRRRQRS
jgi:hypothetical protein